MTPQVPAYPNLGPAIGSVLPVITALLATVSAATFLVPLAGQGAAATLTLGDSSVSTADAGIAFGILATLAFVGATLALANSYAQSFDALPTERQIEIFTDAGVTDATDYPGYRTAYRKASDRWYRFGAAQWLLGVYFYVLCLAALVFPYMVWLSAVLAAAAVVSACSVYAVTSVVRSSILRAAATLLLLGLAVLVGAAIVLE